MSEINFPGFWGETTATIDWCEANYEVTYYIAEFWNTISNAFMIVLPVFGIIYGIKDKLEARFVWCFLSLLFVGIGSTLFHGTLLYESQLLDEIPMIWGSACIIYSLKEVSGTRGSHNTPLMLFLFLYCSLVTAIYLFIKWPVFHEAAYALLVFTMIYYSSIIIRRHEHSWFLFVVSISLYASAFFIWNMDNIFCDSFKAARQAVGYPFKPLFQGHAWWHVLAGISTYLTCLFSVHARSRYLKQKIDFQLPLKLVPVIRTDLKKLQDKKPHLNRSPKKIAK